MSTMKFIYSAISSAYRNYSTQKFTSKTTKLGRSNLRNHKYKTKKYDPTSPRRSKLNWTDEQSRVLCAVSNQQSVFITGSAGCGKTVLVRHIVQRLKKIYGPSGVFVTASTGVAACALNGLTLHAFAGIGLGGSDKENLLLRVVSDKKALRRWEKVKALVIDEISMVDAELFDNLDYIAKQTRFNDKVWGGIQLIVTGDFFQLPPIPNRRNYSKKEFAFEADCWNSSFDLQVELTTIYRQSDNQLVKLLNGIRRGEPDPDDLQLLEKCCSEDEPSPSVLRLYPLMEDVDRVNRERLENLGMDCAVYVANDTGEYPWKKQLKKGIAPDVLELCEGARVMLIKNLNSRLKLVNGAVGTVIDYAYDKSVSDLYGENLVPIVKFDSGTVKAIGPEEWEVMEGEIIYARRKQIPLVLAWAISIHKCQGMTLDSLHTDLSRAFGYGMVYVTLSRIRSLDGLHLSGFQPSKIKAHPKVLQFYQHFASKKDTDNVDDDVTATATNKG